MCGIDMKKYEESSYSCNVRSRFSGFPHATAAACALSFANFFFFYIYIYILKMLFSKFIISLFQNQF